MTLLIAGLILFTGTHLVLALAPAAIEARRQSLGEGPVKGLVSLPSLAGIVLIVLGWRSTLPSLVYIPPAALHSVGLLLVAIGIYLFVVANRPSIVKRFLRHPQLTGLILWCTGHLMLNGDNRSLVLFGAFAAWAIIEIPLINAREGAWVRPEAPPMKTDLITAVIAIIAYLVLVAAHPWLAGVPVLNLG